MLDESGGDEYVRKTVMLTVILILTITLVVHAGWSGSQSITWERHPDQGLIAITTSVLDYALTRDWRLTLIADNHPVHGLDVDLSTTVYFQPLGQLLYATVGVRRGLFWNTTPYLTVAYRF